jgi:hypothetical protein
MQHSSGQCDARLIFGLQQYFILATHHLCLFFFLGILAALPLPSVEIFEQRYISLRCRLQILHYAKFERAPAPRGLLSKGR